MNIAGRRTCRKLCTCPRRRARRRRRSSSTTNLKIHKRANWSRLTKLNLPTSERWRPEISTTRRGTFWLISSIATFSSCSDTRARMRRSRFSSAACCTPSRKKPRRAWRRRWNCIGAQNWARAARSPTVNPTKALARRSSKSFASRKPSSYSSRCQSSETLTRSPPQKFAPQACSRTPETSSVCSRRRRTPIGCACRSGICCSEP